MHLTDEVFLTRVQHRLGMHDTTRADEASIAVLETLIDSLTPDEARALSGALPPRLGRRLGVVDTPVVAARSRGGQHAVGPLD
ncbi:uncharacterized protein DUF2267 [Pseudonocardia sediminis]|uniref:Uncharacterized protein DUF2267 n=1 Tax=Pseudonocardia sediminis TaxID=1397368 RepID=A0A4V2FQW5_PSEST|nr:DUF2267 domain-containing protein [Pseudonocardia sediminis]RZT86130.1 uncharacterized protein DUF2267 [Pseudonocardia sediminis]